jgi:hypothetical protein
MSSIAKLVKLARRELKARPMAPFGAPIEIGSIGVIEDDRFIRRGTPESILKNKDVGGFAESKEDTTFQKTSGRDVKLNFLAKGELSKLFPNAPPGDARIEVSFNSENSCLLSVKGYRVRTLRDPAPLIGRILDAYRRGRWRKEYVLIYETITPAEAMMLAATSAGTNLLLSATAPVTPADVAAVAGSFKVEYQTQEVLSVDSGGQPLFYNCYRVKRKWLAGAPVITAFAAQDITGDFFERV